MPVHDWSLVAAGLFHDFRHSWIEELKRVLNGKVLPSDCYAVVERPPAAFEPGLNQYEPRRSNVNDSEAQFHRQRLTRVAVRHASDDRCIAAIEVAWHNGQPFALVASEIVRAFVSTLAVGDRLPDMPLFLAPRACVEVPLEETYLAAFAACPRRWRHILEQPKR